MTQRLDEVIEQLRHLPAPEQDTIAAIIQDELEDAERWRRRLVAAENAEVEQRNANVAAKRAADQKRDSAESAAPARKQAAPKASKATATESQ